MEYPNVIEIRMLSGGITEKDCKECKVKQCDWSEEYGCAVAWYNMFKRTITNDKSFENKAEEKR